MKTFLKTNHQLKQWLPRVKLLAIATSMATGLVVSESVWAGCEKVQPTTTYYYYKCTETGDEFHTPPELDYCQAKCVSAPTTYTLTLNTTGTGTGTVNGGGSFSEGTKVDLVATPAADSTFAGWSSGCSSGMTLMANTTCTATFNKGDSTTPTTTPTTSSTPPLPENMSVFIQVDGNGSGSVSTGAGLSCKREDCQPNADGKLVCQENCRQVVKTASNVTLTPKADANSVFSSWGGNPDCVDGQLANITFSTLCTAYFHRLYKLTVAVDGPGIVTGMTPGYGSKTPINCGQGQTQCNNTYESTIKDTLQAQPLGNAMFLGWVGDCNQNSTSNGVLQEVHKSISLNRDKDMTCQAHFVDPLSNLITTPIDAAIVKNQQTITNFSPATSAVVGDQVTLTATGGASNNPVTFASTTPEVCTVSGNTLKVTKAGTCTVTADQVENDQYNPADQVTANITVNNPAKLDQTITKFSPATSAEVKSQVTLTATGGASGKPVIYASTTPAVCTVSDNQTVTLVTTGTCTVTANQDGNDLYNAAPTVTANIQVNAPVVKKDQVITNFAPTGYAFTVDKAMVNGQTTLTATGGASGNPVTYTSTTPTVCTVSGNTVSLLAVGTCNLTAIQEGNDLYNPASPVTTAIQVNQPVETAAPTTSNWALVTTSTVGNSLTLTATGDTSANPVTFTSATPTVCTVSGNTVRLDAVGTCTVTATQAGSATSTVVATITVNPVPAATTVTTSPTVTEPPVSLPVPGCPGITEENGVYLVSASCDANGYIFDKPVVVKRGVSLSNATFNNTVDNQGLASNVTIGEKGEVKGGMLSGSVKNQGKVCDIEFVGDSFVGGTVCGKINNASKVGACLILENVTVLPDTTFKGCVKKKDQAIMVDMVEDTGSETTGNTSSTTSPTPVKKEQTITFDEVSSLTTAKVGSQQLLQVTASSGLVVNLVSDTPQVCKLFGSAVTFLTTGTCTVTANQAGNDGYNAAKPVSANITVVKKEDQTIQFTPPPYGKVGETLIVGAGGGQSGNPVTFASDSTTICTLSGNTLKFIATGICTVTASQAGNDQYNAATPVSAHIKISNFALATASITGPRPCTGIDCPTTQFTTSMQVFGFISVNTLKIIPSGNSVKISVPNFVKIISAKTTFFGDIDDSGEMPSFKEAKKALEEKPHTRVRPTFDGNNLAFLNILGDSLEAAGYLRNDLVVGADGTLFIANDTHGLLARPGETTAYTGTQSPGLYSPEEGIPYLVFADTDGQLKQTSFYPMLSPVIETVLSQELPTTIVESALDGTLKLTFEGGFFSFWQAGYVVTSGNETLEMNVVGDNLVISAGGQSQEFTPGTPTFDESSIEFLKVVWKGVKELGFDPNNLMLTSLGSFVIVDANDEVIVSFQAGEPTVDTGNQPAGLYVPQGETPYVLFVDVDNQLKRSLLSPALSPDILATALEAFPNATFTLAPEGKVTVSFDGEEATEWQPAYLVTTGGETFEKQLVEGQLILSGGGQSQILLPVQP